MERLSQIAIAAPNRQGLLAEVCKELGAADVNIVAILVPMSIGAGTLRLVPDDLDRAKEVFDRLGFPYTVEDVLGIHLPNEPGALGRIAETLGIAQIAVESLYCTTDARGRAERVILSVSDPDRAAELLENEE